MRTAAPFSVLRSPLGCRTALVLAAAVSLAGSIAVTAEAQSVDRGTWLRDRIAAARPGDVIDVPPGEHRGPFVIAQSVHLRGHQRAILRGDGRSHVVSVRAPNVVIEGFEIRDSGLDLSKDHAAVHVTAPGVVVRDNRIAESLHGVYVRQADRARIERNVITGKSHTLEPVNPFTSRPAPGGGELCEVALVQDRRGNGIHIWNSVGHLVAGNVIRDTRDGIYFSFADQSDVRDNDIAGVRYGLHYMYSDDNRFEGNRFRDSAAGAALMYSKGITLRGNAFTGNRNHRAHGLLMYSVDETDILENRIVGNTMGLFIEHSQGNRITGNTVTNNHVGVHISNSSDGNTFAGNVFTGNLHPVETSGTNMRNQWAVDGRGNLLGRRRASRSRRERHRRHSAPRAGSVRRPAPAVSRRRPALRQSWRAVAAVRPCTPGAPRAPQPPGSGAAASRATAMIVITDLMKSYGTRRVLDGLSFEARAGEVTLLVGANGCGKTTTMRLIAGLSAPDRGTIAIAGEPTSSRQSAALDALSYLPQSPHFHPLLTVRQILEFYARLRGLPLSRAESVAERWGLAESRGVRLRAAVGRHAAASGNCRAVHARRARPRARRARPESRSRLASLPAGRVARGRAARTDRARVDTPAR